MTHWFICVTFHIPLRDMTHWYASWLIHACDMIYSYVWHASCGKETWRIYLCVMTHSLRDWRIHMCDVPHSTQKHDSFICVTCLIWKRNMTHSHVCYGAFITWLMYSHIWCSSFNSETWSIHMCDMPHLEKKHDAFTCVLWRIHHVTDICTRVTFLIQLRDRTHSHVWCLIHMCDITHPHAWRASFKEERRRIHMCHDSSKCVT